jgi:methyl-accepting chemotaxis protein
VGAPLLTDPLDSMLQGSARGLRASGEAINSITDGVSNSTGMINEVKHSMETTSGALSSTAEVLQQTVEILEETRIILPAMANDMASMPPMLRNLMPNNHFDEISERTETVAVKLGLLNTQLENLSTDVMETSDAIGGVAVSVETVQEDLLSAEGSFSKAAEKMEATACFVENGSFSSMVAVLSAGIGVLLLLVGLYQFFSAFIIRRLMKGQAVK